jgi:hypothetical protein
LVVYLPVTFRCSPGVTTPLLTDNVRAPTTGVWIVVVGLVTTVADGETTVCRLTTNELALSEGTRKQPEIDPLIDCWSEASTDEQLDVVQEVVSGASDSVVVVVGAAVLFALAHAASNSAAAIITAPCRATIRVLSLMRLSLPHPQCTTPEAPGVVRRKASNPT